MKQEIELEQMLLTSPFEEIRQQMETDRFWLRVFIRPCCARPNAKAAHMKVEGLRSTLSARAEFSQSQRDDLSAIIDSREAWYVNHMAGSMMR